MTFLSFIGPAFTGGAFRVGMTAVSRPALLLNDDERAVPDCVQLRGSITVLINGETDVPRRRKNEGHMTMKTLIKTTIAAIATIGMILGGMTAPTAASAQPSYVCKVEKSNGAQTGLILGALLGGVVGNKLAKNERGLGTVAGAVIGGAVGNKLGKDAGKSSCNRIEAAAQERYGYGQPYRSNYSYSRQGSRYQTSHSQPVRRDHYGYRY